ncbi:hypothetical protein [Mycolicibacterium aubagnense]|uniref:Uncharacterized protein n=1 Tax=Mycolicibacterium aubagnense TaxID=319707 RepID=A0ABN5YMK1_9MYCO|nr:hypothetical protein [Mycolicibacterium aubagnense]WGI35084.1 hypothetical protein QDT91_12490 [Mycolicibacterium aubagnense]BBX82977.1 hypothetical protein MAUB_08500 [Mycolicibacterium aubagnense]
MNKIRSTVRIMVRAAALSARLTRCVAIRLIGYAIKPPSTGSHRAPVPGSEIGTGTA